MANAPLLAAQQGSATISVLPRIARAGEPVAVILPRLDEVPSGCFALKGRRVACIVAVPLEAKSPFDVEVAGRKVSLRLATRRDPHSTVTFRVKTSKKNAEDAVPDWVPFQDVPVDGREAFRAATATSASDRLWREPFARPLRGAGHRFALRRTYYRYRDGKLERRWAGRHLGVDIGASRGTPIRAANAGRVVLTGYFHGTGRCVYVDHGLGLFTMYFHMDSVAVATGNVVKRGQTIGRVGTTGSSTAPHLHWEARINRVVRGVLLRASVDPERLVPLSRLIAER